MKTPEIVFAWARDGRGMGFPERRCLTTRAVVRRDRLRWQSIDRKPASYRLSNGRLPEFQPIVSELEARAWLAENPNAIAWEVRP